VLLMVLMFGAKGSATTAHRPSAAV